MDLGWYLVIFLLSEFMFLNYTLNFAPQLSKSMYYGS